MTFRGTTRRGKGVNLPALASTPVMYCVGSFPPQRRSAALLGPNCDRSPSLVPGRWRWEGLNLRPAGWFHPAALPLSYIAVPPRLAGATPPIHSASRRPALISGQRDLQQPGSGAHCAIVRPRFRWRFLAFRPVVRSARKRSFASWFSPWPLCATRRDRRRFWLIPGTPRIRLGFHYPLTAPARGPGIR